MLQISADALYALTQKQGKVTIIDVRTPQEYARGFIVGSINIPLEQIEREVSRHAIGKKERIIVYCLSGSRSSIAKEHLETRGYRNVGELQSGLLAWRMMRYPLVTT